MSQMMVAAKSLMRQKSTPVQVRSHVILPILQEDGHLGPHCRTTHADVLEVTSRGHEWQLASERGRGLCKLRHLEPSGDYRHREGLLELPVLGAPLDGSEHLHCKLLSLVTECRQTLDSLMVGAKSAEDNGSCTF